MSGKLFIFILLLGVAFYANAQKIYPLDSSDNICWKVFPVDSVSTSVNTLSGVSYDMSAWIKSKVPGTFFVDYVNAGIEKNPDFGDNIYQVDEKKYNRPFWYRVVFELPDNFIREKVWLNFKNINKEGAFWLNSQLLGTVKGFMKRSQFDVTSKLKAGKNVLLVKVNVPDVRKERQPTWALDTWANFAMPSFMSSAGWDWMPYVPGLNCGITGNVYLSTTGSVKLKDTWVRTELVDLQNANISVQTTVVNNTDQTVDGILNINVSPGNISVAKNVSVQPRQSLTVNLDNNEFQQLAVSQPELWYPVGYGKPNLYTLKLNFTTENTMSDTDTVTFGIKKYSYKTENGAFTLYVNNSKVLVRGGNWGMTEYLQRTSAEDYETRIKLHADMNFNMIRLWTGCVTDDAFYDFCDKYGIMVWDDFWFHGNLFPPDESVFMSNAQDKIMCLRNHPCIAVWCGANEGVPAGDLDSLLNESVSVFDGDDRHYQSCSNKGGGLSGSGWWVNMHPRDYFNGPSGGGGDWNGADTWAFRTEIGTATFTTFESFREFMPEADWWPPKNEMWNKHFFGKQAETAGTDTYFNTVNANYGVSAGIDEFCEKSQYLNLEVMKAIYEGWNDNMWNNATGVLIWMSQSAYPSLVWQTYDYYFDATGAYWGAKKACEPLHIQWNYANNSVKVINTTLTDYTNLKAKATVYNLKGEVFAPLSREQVLSAASNTATSCFVLADESQINLAKSKNVVASANNSDTEGVASRAVDGNLSSRWGSGYYNNAWLYVDLGKVTTVGKVKIFWEGAYGKKYLIQVSDDAQNWKTVYTQNTGKGGSEMLTFDPVEARYVKFQGVERATGWGYSFYEFEVYAPEVAPDGSQTELSKLNFIKLELFNQQDSLISENFYWRNMDQYNYQDLNSLPKADVSLTETRISSDGKYKLSCIVRNNSSTVAFGNRLKVINKQTGKRVLPIYMNDNYFTLMPGESKKINIEFASNLVGDADFQVVLKRYGNYNSSPDTADDIIFSEIQDVEVFPNPASETIFIRSSSMKDCKIFDIFGKLIYKGSGSAQIDVSGFANGLYVLKINQGDRIRTVKFVKN